MGLVKIEHGALVPIYANAGNSRGFYRILPGYPSYICLNESLLEGDEEVHQFVYQTLLDYHNSIPSDSKQRVFEAVFYFEELGVIPVPVRQEVQEIQIVMIGRAVRRWRFSFPGDQARVIGKAG